MASDKQRLSSTDDVNTGTYSSVRNSTEEMEIDAQDGNLPWNQKYWHLIITHPVSTNEIWARLFDGIDMSDEMIWQFL